MSGINGTGGVKVGELLRECMKALEAAGNDNPRFEAEQLVMKFCGVKRSDILMFPGLEATAEQAAEVRGAVQRRNSGEPLQYILGEWEFYGLPFTSAREFSFRGRILKRSWRPQCGSCGNAGSLRSSRPVRRKRVRRHNTGEAHRNSGEAA